MRGCKILLRCVAGATNRECPQEFPFKRGKSCYRVEGKKTTWQKARNNCLKWNAHLIAIETGDESKFLMNVISSNKGWLST